MPGPKTKNWSALENEHKPSGLHIIVSGLVEVEPDQAPRPPTAPPSLHPVAERGLAEGPADEPVRSVVTTRSSSKPGGLTHTSGSGRWTSSQYRRCARGVSRSSKRTSRGGRAAGGSRSPGTCPTAPCTGRGAPRRSRPSRRPRTPSASQTARRSSHASVGSYTQPRGCGFGRRRTIPCCSSWRSRSESSARGIPGAPVASSPNVRQPSSRLRTMIGVQRVAKISAPRATGQYWP